MLGISPVTVVLAVIFCLLLILCLAWVRQLATELDRVLDNIAEALKVQDESLAEVKSASDSLAAVEVRLSDMEHRLTAIEAKLDGAGKKTMKVRDPKTGRFKSVPRE